MGPMSSQASLFSEPANRPELSQWFTPMALARQLARWVPRNVRVLEPACGSGNLIAALLEQGHDPKLITGVEVDEKWMSFAHDRFKGRVGIYCADFLEHAPLYSDHAEYALTNPPFENGQHSAFVEKLLEIGTSAVVAVLPSSIEFGLDRDQTLWRSKAQVVRRARLPKRVQYGGDFSASFDSVALKIVRRTEPRAPGEVSVVSEEVWL
jgi:predicted RNA methylase